MKKRLLALLLAGAMTLSMMPIGVVAEGESEPVEIIEEVTPAVEETLPEVTEAATEAVEVTEAATEAVEVTEPAKPGIVEAVAALLNNEDPHKTQQGYTKCGHGDENITWTEVSAAAQMPKTTGGYYYLTADISVSSMITLSTAVDITLCLNGHTITGTNRIYKLDNAGVNLTICDCTAHADDSGNYVAGKLIPGVSEGGAIGLYKAATFNMEDVIIDGTGITNTATSGGGAIIVTSGGIVNIRSGEIRNCSAQRGGAIYVYKGTLNMSGGKLIGNTSKTTGGAISTRDNTNDNGTEINITGGQICGNIANYGGAMFLSNAKSVLLQNVTITGNTANSRGGGVDNQTTSGQSLVTVGGKLVITDNYVGKTQQNLNMVNAGRTLNISTSVPLSEDAKIGISTQGQPGKVDWAVTTATEQENVHQYFSSDVGHVMALKDGKVTLISRPHQPGEYQPGHAGVESWTGTATLPTTSGHYYLTSNVSLTAAVAITTEQNIVLCLNGYDIIQTGTGRIYRLSGGAKLTICDCCAHTDENGKYTAGLITGGNTTGGGALFAEHAGTVINFYDGIITGNTTNGQGTIVNQNEATLNLYGGEISGNTVTSNGGAIYTNATFNMYGGVIRGNTSAGAVIHIPKGTANFSGGKIESNTVTGADVGVLSVLSGNISLSGTVISGGSVAGVYITGGEVNMTGGAITGITYNNNAGAAVTVKGGTFNLSGGEICGNNARGVLVAGGAFNLSADGKVNNNTFTVDGVDGAGVRVNSGSFTMTGGQINGNNSAGSGSGGGGLTVRGGEVNVTGGAICNNIAHNAGAIAVNTAGSVSLSNVTISGNVTNNHGTVYVASGTLNIGEGTVIEENTTAYRGTVYVSGASAVVNMTGGLISKNIASAPNGAVHIVSGSFNMSGGQISQHSATRAVLVDGGSFNLSGGKVCNNTFSEYEGTAVRVNSGSFTMTGGEISGNDSGENTGAALRVGDGTVLLSGGKITDNIGTRAPAIVMAGGSVTIEEGFVISGNTSRSQDSGVIHMAGGTVNMNGGEISGNNVRGVFVANDAAVFNISGGKITGNTSTERDGAGMRITAGTITMTGGEISGNIADNASVGGIRVDNGTVNLTGGSITGNKATGVGGLAVLGGTVTAENVTISNNDVVNNGGGIYLDGGSLTLGNGTVVTGNISRQGGGIYAKSGDLTIDGAQIVNNEARVGYGGVYFASQGSLVINGAAMITGNKVADKDSNLALVSGVAFTTEGLAEGAKIGFVTNLEKVYAEGKQLLGAGVKPAELAYFTYEEPTTHTMKVMADGLYMIQDPTTYHKPHKSDICGHEDVSWRAWTSANALPAQSGHWYLTCDVDLASMVGVATAQDITLCLNGFNITATNRVYRLSNGAKLNICDCTAHTDKDGNYVAGIMVPGTSKGGVVGLFTDNEGDASPSFTLYGGIIDGTGVETEASGSAIRLETNGTVNIVDGLIRGCTNAEGVITMTNGTLNISGGKITGNNARGVLVTDGTLNISGGEISGNAFNGTEGVGVRFHRGTFTMTGGKISGNDSLGKNGTAVVIRGGQVNLLGGQISDNIAGSAGAIMMYDGEVIINGTQISDNKATGNAGAVYQMGGKLTVGEKTVISGNTARMGAGIYCTAGDLTIDGASITGNAATVRGGGVDFRSEGVLTINGATKITENTANEKVSNLLLTNGAHFVTEGLAKGCKIGINADVKVMFAEGKQLLGKGVAASELEYFVSEIAGNHTLSVLEDGLYIIQDPNSIHKPHTTDECGHKDVQWTAWTDLTSLPTESGHYYLVENVVLTKAVAIGTEQEVTLCLNGYNVTQTGVGRIYRLSGGAVVNLCDCTAHTDSKGDYIAGMLTGGNTEVNAGAAAVYVAEEGTTLNLYGGKITGNKTEGSGTIVAFKKAKFNMYGGEISGNSVTGQGGGLYINDAEANLLGGVINKNTSKAEGGGVYIVVATVTIDGTKITNNRAEVAAGGVMVAKEAKVEFKSGVISGNEGKNGGGVILQSRGVMTMTGGSISGNYAFNGNGGGVYVSHEGTLNLKAGSINGNTSKKLGGGIYTCDQVNMYGGSVNSNHSGKEGGGIYITESSRKIDGKTVTSDGVLNMYGGSISYNTTATSAAAVLVRGKLGYFNMRGGSVTGNKATATNKGGGHGGAIIAQGKGNFTMYGGTISDNECLNYGGGLASFSEAIIKLYGGTISGNKAFRGAGVYLAGSDEALIDGVTITKNLATDQGAGLYVSEHKVTMNSGVISENEITTSSGAGICLRGGATMIFNGGEVVRNKAPEGHAGGILIQSNAYLQMNGGLVAENFASQSGGGIRSSRCKVEILGGEIRDNITDVSGAGVYGETELIMKNCVVKNNRVTGDKGGSSGGAGIYLARETVYTLENVTITGNYAIGKAGGFQIGYLCKGTVTGCTISGNSASGNGGGVLVYILGDMEMKDTVVEANSAVGFGGGVFLESDTPCTITNCAINKNSAKEGGAVYVSTMGKAIVSDTDMRDNSALVGAGAIYANGSVYLTDVTITGSANKEGSAAVVLDNVDADGESYIPGVNQFEGEIVISGNRNGNLRLINDAFVNIHGDGLTEKSEILVYQPEGGITNVITGPYHYVRNGDEYTITRGDTSLNTPDPETPVAEEGSEGAEGEEETPVTDTQAKNVVLIAFGGVLALAIIIGIVAVVVLRKNKKAKQNT